MDGMHRGITVREAAGDAADMLCFLSDALTSGPTSDLDAASRRGLGRILEDVAVMLAEAVMQEDGSAPAKPSAVGIEGR